MFHPGQPLRRREPPRWMATLVELCAASQFCVCRAATGRPRKPRVAGYGDVRRNVPTGHQGARPVTVRKIAGRQVIARLAFHGWSGPTTTTQLVPRDRRTREMLVLLPRLRRSLHTPSVPLLEPLSATCAVLPIARRNSQSSCKYACRSATKWPREPPIRLMPRKSLPAR